MWIRIDDRLANHPKIFAAARLLGRNWRGAGPSLVLGWYVASLSHCNCNLTDGFIANEYVEKSKHVANPLLLADIMVRVGLWEVVPGGWRIHDYHHYNLHADEVLAKREKDRRRKENDRRARLGLPPLSDECPRGQVADDSTASTVDSPTASAACPRASRARDPVPSRPSTEDPPLPPDDEAAPSALGEGFARFWEAYPKKAGEGAARRVWKRLDPSVALVADIVRAVERQRESPQWTREDGRYIPDPAKWLRDRHWTDQAPATVTPLFQCPHTPRCATERDCVLRLRAERQAEQDAARVEAQRRVAVRRAGGTS